MFFVIIIVLDVSMMTTRVLMSFGVRISTIENKKGIPS
jgi:hypothetical protein